MLKALVAHYCSLGVPIGELSKAEVRGAKVIDSTIEDWQSIATQTRAHTTWQSSTGEGERRL